MQGIEFLVLNKRKSKNFESIYYNKRISVKIVYSGFLLSLAIILNLFSQRFLTFPLVSFLKFDLTIIIFMIAFIKLNLKWTTLLIFLLAIIAPSYSNQGYEIISLFGQFIQSITHFIFVLFFALYINIFNKKCFKLAYLILIKFLTIFSTTFSLIILNMFIFTPIYLTLFKINGNEFVYINYLNNYENWNKIKGLFLGINNYFLAVFVIYLLFNTINLTINSLLVFRIIQINARTNFINKITN
ncbi:Uncharacterised protein [Mycoplasmopsis maculosa]|uniref:Uncharacterized protein n=2 Tax=Mycoplasmopsis maculosa TaxID=114885 RepID=A0A449B3Y9_9BACT|nr:Uncharacterised protein [Mycoplasmopsis maculosa]